MTNGPQLLPVRSPVVGALCIAIGLYGLSTPNPLETIWTGLLLWWICRSFWWQETPAILLFVLIVPFIEIHTGVLNANSSGITLNDAFNGTGRMTFWLSSLGLLMVSLGIRTTLNQAQWSAAFHIDRLRPLLEKTTLTRLILSLIHI